MRDIAGYAEQYRTLPFEATQAACRRNMVLAQIKRLKPKSILEIGCGENPIFVDLSPDIAVAVIEPSEKFIANARRLAAGRGNVSITQGFFEDLPPDVSSCDLILLSSLLHEVDDPQKLLACVRARCAENTTVHVNVPNARSIHRLLGVALGKTPRAAAVSEKQKQLQQYRPPYDPEGLEKEMQKAGFTIQARGGMLVKPLTHAQMQKLMDKHILTKTMIKGLEKLADLIPRNASEIWVNAKVSS